MFLHVASDEDWGRLAACPVFSDIVDDERFKSAADRASLDDALAEAFADVFASESVSTWQTSLIPLGVGCVAVCEEQPARRVLTDPELARAYAVPASSPIFDDHLRLAPLVAFSRSSTRSPGSRSAGAATDAFLDELGYGVETVLKWRESGIIAG